MAKRLFWSTIVIILSVPMALFAQGPTLILKKPSKTKKVGSGFYYAKETCSLYENPSKASKVVMQVKKGRKIWLEPFGSVWKIGADQFGQSVFVQKACVGKNAS